MKLAIISDIHGNSFALDRVLNAIDDEGISKIVCLGDLALLGFDPNGSINRIAERGIPTVRGNADDMLLNGPPLLPETDAARSIGNAWRRWNSEQTGTAERAFLAGLPESIDVEIDGVTLCAYHGSPRSYDEGIRPETPDATLDEFCAGTDADLLAGGHTHGMMLRRWRGRTVINPGTVGLPFVRMAADAPGIGNWAEYAVITVENGEIDISFRHLPIERDAIATTVYASGIPHADVWIERWSGGWEA